jgi:heat shock protein HtpX
MFAILFGLITLIGSLTGSGSYQIYLILAVLLVFIQYMVGPKMVERAMHVKYVSEIEYPELHAMIADLAQRAGIPKPRVGVSRVQIPNAFAFGKSKRDARVCVTEGILRLLSRDELRAVLGHEISHIKHRDVTIIMVLSVVPMVCYFIYISFVWGGMFGGGREKRGEMMLIGLIAMVIYFITSLLVMYGSRIREYYADKGSTELGNEPHHLASALYKLVYGSARASRESLKQVEGFKAFFANDPSRAHTEIKELRGLDMDMSGTIDMSELLVLSDKKVRISTADRIMELMGTHPNMVKRIKHLSSLY